MSQSLQQIFADLPDGPVWITGRLLKAFAAEVIRDRPRLVEGCGDEIPTHAGRFWRIATSQGAGAVSGAVGFRCVKAGTADAPAIRVYYGAVNSRAPDGMVLGDVVPYVLPIGLSAGVVCLGVTVAGADDDVPGVVPNESGYRFIAVYPEMPDDTNVTFYLQICSFGFTEAGSMQVTGTGVGDQSFEACGGVGGVGNWGPA